MQNIQMIVEKIEKIEVHQLHISYQMADVQLRRNDDTDPVHEVTDSSEVFEGPTQVCTIPDCVAEDHEFRIATFADELKANSEGFLTSTYGEGTEHHQCHRTPKRSSSSST